MSGDDLSRVLKSLGKPQGLGALGEGQQATGSTPPTMPGSAPSAVPGSNPGDRVLSEPNQEPVQDERSRRASLRPISPGAYRVADELLAIVDTTPGSYRPAPSGQPAAAVQVGAPVFVSAPTEEPRSSPPAPVSAVAPPSPTGATRIRVQGRLTEPGQPRVELGRAEDSFQPFTDGRVSRQHGIIQLVGGRYYLVDKSSSNGTTVRRNGAEIAVGYEPVPLEPGDVVVTIDEIVLAEIVEDQGTEK